MKNRLNTIVVHIVIWTLLFLVPYVSTYRVVKQFVPDTPLFAFTPMLGMSSFLILIFYVNYFLLIPKYLLERKFGRYALMLGLFLVLGFATSFLIIQLSGLDPSVINEKHPVLESVSPIAQANAFLMLIIGIVTSILLAMNNRLKQIEEEKLSAQIASLHSQINPHFLFNTLNNIYATAIDTSPQTAEMVAQLSEMMRYSMRDIQKDYVDLVEEIAYIDNYISLQKMRLDRKVMLEFQQEGAFEGFQIAPMLMISFIENAFKHGVNAEENSHIYISISMHGNTLDLHVRNNKVHVQSETSVHTGLGIANTRSRLKLIYPTSHVLKISETDAIFEVSLQIQLT